MLSFVNFRKGNSSMQEGKTSCTRGRSSNIELAGEPQKKSFLPYICWQMFLHFCSFPLSLMQHCWWNCLEGVLVQEKVSLPPTRPAKSTWFTLSWLMLLPGPSQWAIFCRQGDPLVWVEERVIGCQCQASVETMLLEMKHGCPCQWSEWRWRFTCVQFVLWSCFFAWEKSQFLLFISQKNEHRGWSDDADAWFPFSSALETIYESSWNSCNVTRCAGLTRTRE